MAIYMWRDAQFATQGPCPDGFHVPTKDDWVSVITAGVTLGAWSTSRGGGNNASIYLKIPATGMRYHVSGNISGVGTGYYWSVTPYSGYGGIHVNYFLYSGGTIYPENTTEYRADAFPIRAFKNESVTPDSSWTTIYSGTGNAGIFWNATLGLISISSDGTTWLTIVDKNLGATEVYNGDYSNPNTASYGYYYQRGNNHGFPTSGSVTTSSTRVDASSYGPGNYYDSSTFITRSSSPYDRSSVQNDNLRGGEDGNVPV